MSLLDIEADQLTILDLLRLHRGWITMLFIDQGMTEVEIIGLLYEHNIFVSLYELRCLLQQWRLVSSPSSARTSTSTRSSSGPDGWVAITTDEPESRSAYERRPLPLLPRSRRTSASRWSRESGRASNGTANRQPGVSQHQQTHRRETEVGSAPTHGGSSPLENYVRDPQMHEMIAIGLVQPQWHGGSSL